MDVELELTKLKEVLESFVQNLRFLHNCTQPVFVVDLLLPHYRVQKKKPNFRQNLYYATMHDAKGECAAVGVQLLIVIGLTIPVFAFAYGSWVVTRDLNWGICSLWDASGFAYYSHMLSSVMFLPIGMIAFSVMNTQNFGNRSHAVEEDRGLKS